MLTEMYHDHGDSEYQSSYRSSPVDVVESYRITIHWKCTSQQSGNIPQDATLEQPFARYYREYPQILHQFAPRSVSSVSSQRLLTVPLDADKQAAINLFLGVPSDPQRDRPVRGGYRQWFKPEHLDAPYVIPLCEDRLREFVKTKGDFWIEYYRPLLFTSLGKHFAYSMNSTLKLPGYALRSIFYSIPDVSPQQNCEGYES